MGILNLTPDSFSDGGRGLDTDVRAAVRAAEAMAAAGVDAIDLGAESTRPGAVRVSEEEETRRLVPVIEAIRAAGEWGTNAVLSVDTTRASVAAAAVAAGADIVNDVSAGAFDCAMLPTVASIGVPFVMMHTRGTPTTMRSLASYPNVGGVTTAVCDELGAAVLRARAAGIPPWRLVADPGIGFAKTEEQNLKLLRDLPEFVTRLVYPTATVGVAGARGGRGGGGESTTFTCLVCLPLSSASTTT
jgi:dihydropteroate synthase